MRVGVLSSSYMETLDVAAEYKGGGVQGHKGVHILGFGFKDFKG